MNTDPSGLSSTTHRYNPPPPGYVIVVCFGYAIAIPSPFFIEEGVCTLIALGLTSYVILGSIYSSPEVQEQLKNVSLQADCWLNNYAQHVAEPTPEPKMVPPIIQTDTDKKEKNKHRFYFNELGRYPSPGDSTKRIVEELQRISYIDGVAGLISQIESAQKAVDKGNNHYMKFLMGRKYEAIRALKYAFHHKLKRINSTAKDYDLIVEDYFTIEYIEVKWSETAVNTATLAGVVSESKLHYSGSYLLEATIIGNQKILIKNGGKYFPSVYRYFIP